MMKALYTLALACIGLSASAQLFVLDQKELQGEGPSDQISNDYEVKVSTEEAEGVALSWYIIENSLPSGWNVTICDNKNCIADPELMKQYDCSAFGKAEGAFFKYSVIANKAGGEGCLKTRVFDKDNPDDADTISLCYNAWYVGLQNAKAAELSLYPNPSRGVVSVGLDQLPGKDFKAIVFDQTARQLGTYRLNQGTLSTHGWKPGVYLIQVWNEQDLVGRSRLVVGE